MCLHYLLLLLYRLETRVFFISNDVGLTIAGSKHTLNHAGTRLLWFSQLMSMLKARQAIPHCAHYDSVSIQTYTLIFILSLTCSSVFDIAYTFVQGSK